MARIVGQATSGLAPKYILMTPVEAVRRVAQKVGWTLEDVDLFEMNEAFSVQLRRRAAASSGSIRRRSTSTAAPWRSAIRSAPAARAS